MQLTQSWSPLQIYGGRWAFTYLDQAQTQSPYFYLALFSQTSTEPSPPAGEDLAQLLDAVDGVSFGQFFGCVSPVLIEPSDALFVLQLFAAALPAIGGDPFGAFVWPRDVREPSRTLDRSLSLARSGGAWSLSLSAPNIVVQGDADTVLKLRPAAAGDGDLNVSSGMVTLGLARPASLTSGSAILAPQILATLNLADANAYGRLSIQGALGGDPSSVHLGFTFTLSASPSVTSPSGGATSHLFYPLLDASTYGDLGVQQARLDTTADGTSTLTFPALPAALPSGYRTALGETVMLGAPKAGGDLSLLAETAGDGFLSFAPSGAWAASIARGAQQFDLVCGLSGLESMTLQAGDLLNFFPGQPALVYAAPPAGGGDTALTPHLRWGTTGSGNAATAYVAPGPAGNTTVAYARHSQAVPLFAVAAALDGLLDAVDPATLDLAAPDPKGANAFPMVPYAGLSAGRDPPDANLLAAMEGAILAPQRQAIILNTGHSPSGPAATTVAITPQGFVLTYAGGALSKIQFAASQDGSDAVAVSFAAGSQWSTAFDDALGDAQPFIVVSVQDPTSGDVITSGLTLDGWVLDLSLASQAQAAAGAYGAILIVKAAGAAVSHLVGNPDVWADRAAFNESTVDKSGEILAGYLKDYIAQTRVAYADGQGVADFGPFLQAVDNPQWTGLMVLNAPIDLQGCPAEVQAMLVGADLQGGPIAAHHILATPARVALTNGEAAAASSFDAVIHYLRPGSNLASLLKGEVGILPSTGSDQFMLLYLRAVFKNAVLMHFASAAALVISQMFGETVAAGSLDGGLVTGTNAVVVEGVMHRSGGGAPTYAFTAPRSTASVFYLASSAIDYVLVDKVSTDIVQTVTGTAPNITTATRIAFTLGGWMRMRAEPGFDLSSYEAIVLDGLAVEMSYAVGASPTAPSFVFDTSNLAISAAQELKAAQNPSQSSQAPTATLYRGASLVAQWPMRLAGLILPASGQSPADLGYQSMSLPTTGAPPVPDLSGGWYGLRLALALGSSGMANTPQLLSGEVLLAWAPTAAGAPPPPVGLAPYFKLIGPDGASLQFEVEGVISVGIASVRLRLEKPGVAGSPFLLELQGIGVTVLSKTLPMNGGATVYLGGVAGAGGSRSLGWYGGAVGAESGS